MLVELYKTRLVLDVMSFLLNPKLTGCIIMGLYVLMGLAQFKTGNWRMGSYWLMAAGITYVLTF